MGFSPRKTIRPLGEEVLRPGWAEGRLSSGDTDLYKEDVLFSHFFPWWLDYSLSKLVFLFEAP